MYAKILKGSYGKPCKKCGKVHTDAYAAEAEHVGKEGELVEKANPYHGPGGRFTSKPGGSGGKGSGGDGSGSSGKAKGKSSTSDDKESLAKSFPAREKSAGKDTETAAWYDKHNDKYIAGTKATATPKGSINESVIAHSNAMTSHTLAAESAAAAGNKGKAKFHQEAAAHHKSREDYYTKERNKLPDDKPTPKLMSFEDLMGSSDKSNSKAKSKKSEASYWKQTLGL